MSEERLIKKYANRRLYDVANGCHITLAQVRELLEDGASVRVVEDKSGKDITRHILLQIIAEREDQGEALLSTPFLQHLIRFYGSGMQGLMNQHLDAAMDVFMQNQQRIQEQFSDLLADTPLGSMTRMSVRNMQRLQRMQAQFLRSMVAGNNDDNEDPDADP